MGQMDNMPKDRSLASLLAGLQPGKLPLDVFNQIARLTVTPVVEVVPYFKGSDGQAKVHLLQRSSDDPNWANMYHVPGTIVLASDNPGSFSDALSRITNSKLAAYEPRAAEFVGTQLCKVSRGMEVAIIFAAELRKSPDKESLFDLSSLPAELIEGQDAFIEMAFKKVSN
jgi:hypothetical protein